MLRRIRGVFTVGAGASAVLTILKRLCKRAAVYRASLTQGKYRLTSQNPLGILDSPKANPG